MAQTWAAKAAADVVERFWDVALPEGDGVSAVSTSASGVTVDATDVIGSDRVSVTLSAGVEGATGSVAVTVTTSEGLSLSETFLIAVRATAPQLGDTLQSICSFALRKLVGNVGTPTTAELDDAVERFNDLVALWALEGVDIGLSEPLALADNVSLPDGYIAALKFNLRVSVHSHYGFPQDAYDLMMAEATKRSLTNTLVQFGDLTMPRDLRTHRRIEAA